VNQNGVKFQANLQVLTTITLKVIFIGRKNLLFFTHWTM